MRGCRRSRLALLVGSLLVLGLPGCDKGEKRKLTDVEAPAEGITLRYDLSPGQTYDGNVRMRNTIRSPVGDVIQTIEFDVVLLASGIGSAERQLMIATVDDIGFDLRLPDGIPAEAAGGLTPELAAQLNGLELRFQLDQLGDVSEMPEPPKDQPPQVQAMIGMLAGALSSAFVRVPDKPIKKGESWDASGEPQPGQEDLVRTGSGTFKGMARDAERNEELVKLDLSGKTEGTVDANGKKQKISSEQKANVLFSVTAGFPAKVARKRSGAAAGIGDMFTEIDADWTKGERKAVQVEPQAVVQEINDPCDPDYVGAEDCVDEDEAPPAEAPAEETPEP
jgi:hypothetical protein